MASKKSGMDLGKVLLWSAVLVESPRWAGAMLAADVSMVPAPLSVFLNVMNTVSGVAMGIVVVVATAYLLDAVRQTKPTVVVRKRSEGGKRKVVMVDKANFRFWGLLFFSGGLLALTPFVLGPYIVSRMTGETIAKVLAFSFWQYAWSVAVVVAPAFVVGGVAFAQPGLVKISESGAKVAETVSEIKPKVVRVKDEKPETFGKWKTWRNVPLGERLRIARMTMEQARDTYGVSERTAYHWLVYAKGEEGVVGEVKAFSDQLSVSGEQ